MGRYRGYDDSLGNLRKDLEDLRALVKESLAAKRLARSAMAEGGSMIIRGILTIAGRLDVMGDVLLKSGAGDDVVRMGTMPHGDTGLEFRREDGTQAFSMAKPFGPDSPQMWLLYDRIGQQVVAENSLGPGLSRPHLEHPVQPVAATSGTAVTCGPYGWERQTSSTAWVTLFAYDGKVQNPFVDFKFAAFCSDGTTAGEIQVVDLETGTPLSGFLEGAWVGSVPAGTTAYLIVDPPSTRVATPDVSDFGSYMRLGVQVRRTAGTGSITIAVPQAIGG